jgi:DNA-binding protein H-NS
MASTPNLRSMSIDKLSKLRDQVDTLLAAKVTDERRALQAQLGKLSRYGAGASPLKGYRGGVRGTVAPKYRNPDNPSETWAGRGLRPRWLAAALKSGKKLEGFAISNATKTAARKAPTKSRGRARKK